MDIVCIYLRESVSYIYIYIYIEREREREFCYGVYNQCESFICLDLMVKKREIPIERYFKR
jgi:hypothetical protein